MKTPEEFADNFIASNDKDRLLFMDDAIGNWIDDTKLRAFIISIYNEGIASCEEGVSKLVAALGNRDETIKSLHSKINELFKELLNKDAAIAALHEEIKELQNICHDLAEAADEANSAIYYNK